MSAAVPAYRNSQLRLLGSCAFAYAESYVHGREGQPSPSLLAGRNVHDAVLLAVRAILAGEPLDVHGLAYRAVRGGSVEYADAVEVLTRFTEALGDGDIRIDRKAVFLAEERLEMPLRLWNGNEVTYFGTPDLVQRTDRRTCVIEDWKTHWHPEGEEEFRADPQLKRYALLVAHHYPAFERFVVRKHFVRYRRSAHEITLTRPELDQVRIELVSEIQIAREVEAAGVFAATGGDWCGLCAHTHRCPLIARWRGEGVDLAISDDSTASEMAGAAVALDAAAKRLKDRLKRYLGDEHPTGVVPVAGGEYGYAPTSERSCSLPDLRKAFADQGASVPDDVLKVDLTQLDRLKRRIPDSLVAAIDATIEHSEGARCQFRRTPRERAANGPAGTAAVPVTPPVEDLL